MKKRLNLIFGAAISLLFIFLAFRQTHIADIVDAIKKSLGPYLLLLLFFVLFSAYLRAIRWKYFLLPLKNVRSSNLLSALMIGYGANVILPAHLGEVMRAFILGRKEKISVSSVLATIFVERIIDVLTFLFLLIFLLLFYDFPHWVKESALILLTIAVFISGFLVFIAQKTSTALNFLNFFLKPLPDSIKNKLNQIVLTFVSGLRALKKKSHYFIIFFLSIAIWIGYVMGFASGILSFHLKLPWIAPLVLMVLTTISIVVPSSPGYIGTYHYLCQLGLSFFGVDKNEALAVAIIMHAFNTLPFLIIGIYYSWREGFNLIKFSKSSEVNPPAIPAEIMEKNYANEK